MADVSRQIVAVNGAEWLDLEARARAAGMSMPQYLRSLCGLSARCVIAAGEPIRAEPAHGRQPTHALERRTITVPLSPEDRERLLEEARCAGVGSLGQYIRSRAGLQIRNTSLPGTAERDEEEDDAWGRLQRLGLSAKDYFTS